MKIKVLGEGLHFGKKRLVKDTYRCVPFFDRMKKLVTKKDLEKKASFRLFYHPFWVAKTLVIAERPPFSPKKIPNMLFVDAVSGYRGMFSHVPKITEKKVSKRVLQTPVIASKEEAKRYITDIQVHQINRSYLLKKPKHKLLALNMLYLPIWEVCVEVEGEERYFYINGNTGENEAFLAKQWEKRKDLLLE